MLDHRFKFVLFLSAAIPLSGSIEGVAYAKGDNVVAALKLKDGGVVQFIELVPGELAISAQTPARPRGQRDSDLTNRLSARQLSSGKAVDIYRALSGGRQPPAALVRAQQRVEQALRREAASSLAKVPAAQSHPPAIERRVATIVVRAADTGSYFNDNYCVNHFPPGGTSYYQWDFARCYLYRTGDAGTVVEQSFAMHSVASPYQGNVTHSLQYWSCGLFSCDWETSISRVVAQGWVNHIWTNGPFRYRRATLRDAVGDGFHWAVYGENDEFGTIVQE